ncbi:hypothetical protein B2J88_45225 [Rhodococcus sp. SRB_17]|nr:hypothetical protein [Rhodococcus sp. SRB_17]
MTIRYATLASPTLRTAYDELDAPRSDIHALEADARARGWNDEAARHNRVADALTDHLAASTAERPSTPRG